MERLWEALSCPQGREVQSKSCRILLCSPTRNGWGSRGPETGRAWELGGWGSLEEAFWAQQGSECRVQALLLLFQTTHPEPVPCLSHTQLGVSLQATGTCPTGQT